MASVWEELKRRNVVRVGIAYAVISWLILQLTDVLDQLLGLPDWAGKVVLTLLLIGFLLAVFLAWVYELTPEGLKKEKDVDRSQSITNVTGRKLDFVIIGVLAVALTYFVVERFMWRGDLASSSQDGTSVAAHQGREKSIAVLPFVNMSADPEQEYFSDGISEEILNGLVKVPGLRVVARTSAFSFKGQNIDIREVGETLNANHVLEGSVRKAGNRLRITAQLISVVDGYHLWSETYDRQIDDIFAIQDEIARAVVSALEVTLGFTGETSLVQQGTSNTEAYNWFLRGNYYIGRQSPEDFEKAIESYSKSIELDPDFAGGHGGLAYGLAYSATYGPFLQVKDRVRESYGRALAIDENQIHALLARAVDAALTDHDFAAAEQAVRRALAANIDKTLVTDAYWWLILSTQRRFDEALGYLAIAEQADPLSPLVKQGIGYNLAWSGDCPAAVPYLEAAFDLNPNDFFSTFMLGICHVEMGRFDEAESAIRETEALDAPKAFSLLSRGALHVARNDESSARQVLEQMIALHDSGNDFPLLAPAIGVLYTHLGQIEEAINWYERATEVPNPFHALGASFFYQNSALWDHPRFQALLRKINVDDASVAAAKVAIAGR
jgi:TolB-like protein/tetratricopeptide (TPR) repeat protein